MRLIFIYGPPASGKLIVAEKLSDRTGIPLFHSHLSRDLVKSIYGDKLRGDYELVNRIRFDVFSYCSKNNTDLIFTYVYAGSDDNGDVHEYIKTIEDNGGEVFFVELSASRDDLITRVSDESRKRYKKLSDPEVMKDITQDMSKYSIPFVEALKIDTSVSSPEDAAALISKTYELD